MWANSPLQASYEAFWGHELTFGAGTFSVTEDLQHWVNDGLMVIFFFVVGLEIKRELVRGELRDPRAAALPAVAALGGVVLPALLFVAFTAGSEGVAGWGIPMATDIAFAVGVLALLGSRVPAGAELLLLLTVAIVDDIIAIGVIAIFYSDSISTSWLAAAVVGKVVGVSGGVALMVRTGWGHLPEGVHARHAIGVAALAGIGFTVSLFIAELAYTDPALVGTRTISSRQLPDVGSCRFWLGS